MRAQVVAYLLMAMMRRGVDASSECMYVAKSCSRMLVSAAKCALFQGREDGALFRVLLASCRLAALCAQEAQLLSFAVESSLMPRLCLPQLLQGVLLLRSCP